MEGGGGVLKRSAKTKRGARKLREREPKVLEERKRVVVVRGHRTSDLVNDVLGDLALMKKPYVTVLRRKNEVLPFEEDASLAFLADRNEAGLAVLGNHIKKRPHNLVFARLFRAQILEMYEFGVDDFRSIHEFPTSFSLDSKPCMLLVGDAWTSDEVLKSAANLFVDFFRGRVVSQIDLIGLERVLVLTADQNHVYLRHYAIHLKRSGQRLPLVQLERIGPSADLTLRRSRLPAPDLLRLALKVPREAKERKIKNVSEELLGKFGRIHTERQDTATLQTRKIKALKRKRSAERAAGSDAEDDGSYGYNLDD